MKVLAAHIASWVLTLLGSWTYRASMRLLVWSDSVEDWAGIGMADLPEGIWMRGDRVAPYMPDADEYKVGGTD